MKNENVSDWFVGLMVAVFGLIGLLMAIEARDPEIFIFGAGLALFAAVFDYSIVRRRAAPATIGTKGNPHG
jgi:drug/metabolite transporter (DMT)-like permease